MTRSVHQVYFLQVSRGDPAHSGLHLKIGFTSNAMEKRLRQLTSSALAIEKPDVRALAVVRGSRAAESALHREFSDLLIEGPQRECFRPEERLVGYIRWLRNQWYTFVPDDEHCAPIAELEEMPFDLWRPQDGRHVAAPVGQRTLFGSARGPLNIPPRHLTGDDYYTNPVIIAAAREALGGEIDLDPASHAVANRTVRASRFFTKGDDGLSREWAGRVWMNPPFSAWEMWSKKALAELASGRVTEMCALAANRTTSAKYFTPFLLAADACCTTHGRIPFGGIAGDALNDGHTIYYFGPHRARFTAAFSGIGKTWVSPDVAVEVAP